VDPAENGPSVLPSKEMISRLSRGMRDPLFLLCLSAGLLAFVVQSGELGTADTTFRLQTTHWLWTGSPQVNADDYPDFGLHGRDGKLWSWYGIGQSLLMLPSDVVATWIAHWHVFANYEEDPAVRSILVTYSTSILVTMLTAWIAFRLLKQFAFTTQQTVAGVVGLLFCTTHLHYTQNMQENNYIMLLTLMGFSFQYEWLRTGRTKALIAGSLALGLNLLTRVTTGIDLIAAAFFLLFLLAFERVEWREVWRKSLAYCKVTFPIYAVFVFIERWYSHYRFGSWTQTYIPIFARESKLNDPKLPANFPWSTPLHVGVMGALFKPEKSIFLFDPLLIISLVLFVMLWKRLSGEVRAYAAASLFLTAFYLCFYARYTYWAGDHAWGDRYVSTAVQFVCLLAMPLLLKFRPTLGNAIWRSSLALIGASSLIQLASTAFWLPLEIYQMETFGHPTFVIALRFKNIVAFALGKMDSWGLNTVAMTQDPWDYVHVTTWNYLPFLLRRVGAAPTWVVDVAFAVWIVGILVLVAVLRRLYRVLQMDEPASVEV